MINLQKFRVTLKTKFWRYSKAFMIFIYIITDMTSLLILSFMSLFLWSQFKSNLYIADYLPLVPLIGLFLLLYIFSGLYSLNQNSVKEFKNLVIMTTIGFITIGLITFLFKIPYKYSRFSFLLSWFFSVFFLPINRAIVREIFVKLKIWGEPILIFGNGTISNNVANFLSKNGKIGLRPFFIISDQYCKRKNKEKSCLLFNQCFSDPALKSLEDFYTAIVVPSEISRRLYFLIVRQRKFHFKRLIIVNEYNPEILVTMEPYDLGGYIGFKIVENLNCHFQKTFKRIIDLLIIFFTTPLLIFLFLLIILLIKIDSKGPVFYEHFRVGYGGAQIAVLKFRTMVVDAQKVLEKHLDKNPDIRIEWQENQKIKNDPRVTRVGKFLRKLSLDELPQIWNVIKGEMSLVGPRPITFDETSKYGDMIKLYYKVKPGITGLWQVSGRNDLSYEQRVVLDNYYIRNWSIWFDLYILFKTIFVVINGKGAY